MMSDRLDNILKQALTPREEPAVGLNQQILCRVEEEEQNMREKKQRMAGFASHPYVQQRMPSHPDVKVNFRPLQGGRMPAAALMAAMVLGIGSVSALAAAKLLMPAEVTQLLGDRKLTEAFQGDGGVVVDETQSIGGYDVTFMGIASGKGISDWETYSNGVLEDDKSYIVVSIANSDGAPMPEVSSEEYSLTDFFVSPLIQGCDPVQYNAVTFGGAGASEDVVDGVRYRIMECANIEMFADRELYLCVTDSTFYTKAAYDYDEGSGRITRNESYGGLNALFKLPIDKSKADPGAAQAYLDAMKEREASESSTTSRSPAGGEEGTDGISPEDMTLQEQEERLKEYWGDGYEEYKAVGEWYHKLTPDNIDEYAVPVESTRQILAIDKDGYIRDWDYEVEGRGGGSGGLVQADWLFKHADPDNPMVIFNYSDSGTMDSVVVETMTRNGDGTVTFVAYIPKED